jgi:hypothetical protein
VGTLNPLAIYRGT